MSRMLQYGGCSHHQQLRPKFRADCDDLPSTAMLVTHEILSKMRLNPPWIRLKWRLKKSENKRITWNFSLGGWNLLQSSAIMLSAILDVNYNQKSQMLESWQPWLKFSKADNILKLKIDLNLVILVFLFQVCVDYLSDGSHFCKTQVMAAIQKWSSKVLCRQTGIFQIFLYFHLTFAQSHLEWKILFTSLGKKFKIIKKSHPETNKVTLYKSKNTLLWCDPL